MKNIVWALLIGVVLSSCSSKPDKSLANATVTVVDEGAKDAGLDLQALGELVKKSPSPAKLEEALNSTGSINNLDLNKDGKVDYIKVAETGSGNVRELTFTDQTPDSISTVVATVRIDKGAVPNSTQANMDISGNQDLYGDNYSYHSSVSVGEVLLLAYLFSPHMPYYSPWGYRSYPGYYRPYAPVPMASYRRTVTTYTSHPTGSLATPAPHAANTNTRRSLSSPTSSQRSFSTRNSSKPVGSGGFGSHSASRSPSSSSSSGFGSSSSSSSSRSGFGRSSSSRSSSSSSRSSGRSFGRSSGRRH